MSKRAWLCGILLLAGCSAGQAPRQAREPDENEMDPLLAATAIPHQRVVEAFVGASTPRDNIDSPAAWRAPDGRVWVLATAKEGERLMVYDGDSGALITTHGTAGSGPNQFRRANGIFVHDDLVFVVERDNRRVQVLELPGFRSLGSFGEAELQQPYGIWLRSSEEGELDVRVTDAYMAGQDPRGEDVVPALDALAERVQRYRVTRSGTGIRAQHAGAIGDTSAAGAIRIPESLWGDPAHDRLLIAEEDVATGTAVREYDLAGRYAGRTHGLGRFRAQAEGIALWQCADGSGYWLMTDQFKDRSLFHVFDRRTLEHRGAFAGDTVANTDGVWLHQQATTRFAHGVFYAVHDDQALGAFAWDDIAAALGLRRECARAE